MSDDDTAIMIRFFTSSNLVDILLLASFALCLYDYVLTFSREVKCIWQRRISAATGLFVLNRYVVLLNCVVRSIQLHPWQSSTTNHADYMCNLLERWDAASTIIMYLSFAGFSALQAYAIYGKDKRFFAFVSVVGALNPVMNIYFTARYSYQAFFPPFTGCSESTHVTEHDFVCLYIIGLVSTLLSEVVVLVLLWRRLAGDVLILRRLKIKTSCTTLLWRDGTVYFVTLIALSIMSLLFISHPIHSFYDISTLTDTLASMCLSHYILHLRAIKPTGGTSNTSLHLSRMSDLRFAQSHVMGPTAQTILDLVDPEVEGSPQLPTETTGGDV